jgi:hypothetical protein
MTTGPMVARLGPACATEPMVGTAGGTACAILTDEMHWIFSRGENSKNFENIIGLELKFEDRRAINHRRNPESLCGMTDLSIKVT